MLDIKEDVSLAEFSTFHVGGAAKFAVAVQTTDDLTEAIAFAAAKKISWRVLGGASNLLVNDDGYKGLIIWYRNKDLVIDAELGFIEVGAGAITAVVAGACARAGLTGFEWAAGVPGTIGGAIYGNAGASNGEMKDCVTSVQVFEKGKIKTYDAAACTFGYRDSIFKKQPASVIIGATIKLARAEDSAAPLEKIKEVLRYRQETQPKGVASSGCVFKNCEPTEAEIVVLRAKKVPDEFLRARRVPAGWLIEHANLKGHIIGTARVSEVHGNFIVTTGVGSRAADILALIAHIKQAVRDQFGVDIVEEISIV